MRTIPSHLRYHFPLRLQGLPPLRLAALLLAPSFPSAASFAQVLYGTLTGGGGDASNAVVPNAKVEAVNTATGVSRTTTSNENGAFQVNDLQAGPYKVTISAPSFGTVIQDGVTIVAHTIRRIETRPQVAQVSKCATVNASTLALRTDRADVNNQITKTQVMNPLFGGSPGLKLSESLETPARLLASGRTPLRRRQPAKIARHQRQRRIVFQQ